MIVRTYVKFIFSCVCTSTYLHSERVKLKDVQTIVYFEIGRRPRFSKEAWPGGVFFIGQFPSHKIRILFIVKCMLAHSVGVLVILISVVVQFADQLDQ